MFENRWDDIAEINNGILNGINEYNSIIAKGSYLEFNQMLSEDLFYNLIYAHVIAMLIEDSSLHISNEAYDILNLDNATKIYDVKWKVDSKYRHIDTENLTVSLETIIDKTFDKRFNSFIQEICAQDILSSNRLAPEISELLSKIFITVIVDTALMVGVEDEDELFDVISRNCRRKSSSIAVRYAKEYTNRGALIYNRIFKHQSNDLGVRIDIDLRKKTDKTLNYARDNLFCQKAVLHIGIESTGSSGTAFKVSDEYALTCAHVVAEAKEVTANVIVGDGYPSDRWKDFGVYDVGFGEVIYSNPSLDIAVLKTDYCGSCYLEIEQENLLPEIGEEVVVFGYPLGFEMPQTNKFGPNISFYRGYVSSNQVKNNNSITYLDIDVKSGNSGSPVLSARTGKVIGIISGAKISGDLLLREKMPYMIPIQHFVKLIKKTI